MSLRLWQLRRLLTQRGVPATAAILLGLTLAGLLGYTVPGILLGGGGAYALVVPEFLTPQDPTA